MTGLRRRALPAAALAAWSAAVSPALLAAGPARATAPAVPAVPEPVQAALRRGGVVLAFRHARAPGTFDPPGMRLGDCATQRNLDAVGRAQARRLGDALHAAGLTPSHVRSSPWCRCLDTARLAFGQASAWEPLGSPADQPPGWREASLATLRAALAAVPAGRFEAWSTHMFVLADLAGVNVASAEALVLAPGDTNGVAVRVLSRWDPTG